MMGLPGRVQRREYQLYLLHVRDRERMDMLRGLKVEVKPIGQIQQEFEKVHGSRFMEI